MIISVDTFFKSQGKENFYTVDDDIITGRATEGELEEEAEACDCARKFKAPD
jgi:hypothetical protein